LEGRNGIWKHPNTWNVLRMWFRFYISYICHACCMYIHSQILCPSFITIQRCFFTKVSVKKRLEAVCSYVLFANYIVFL
jgi:hypothetical protein